MTFTIVPFPSIFAAPMDSRQPRPPSHPPPELGHGKGKGKGKGEGQGGHVVVGYGKGKGKGKGKDKGKGKGFGSQKGASGGAFVFARSFCFCPGKKPLIYVSIHYVGVLRPIFT